MRGTGRVVFAATMLLIVGTIIIMGEHRGPRRCKRLRQRHQVRTHQPQHPGLGHNHPRRDSADRRLLADGGQHLRARRLIIAGSLGAIGAVLSIGGAYPWWSLCVFALCVYIVHGIVVYGRDERTARDDVFGGDDRAAREDERTARTAGV